jgi:phosphoribosylaminoimidazole-succinocarboxamide synthase
MNMNYELDMTFKDTVVAFVKAVSQHCPGEHKTMNRISSPITENGTRDPMTNQFTPSREIMVTFYLTVPIIEFENICRTPTTLIHGFTGYVIGMNFDH